jgi:hypothetical protein
MKRRLTSEQSVTNVMLTEQLNSPGSLPGQSHQEALIFDAPDDRSTFTEIQSGSLLEQ